MNSLESIRNAMKIVRTPQEAGWETTITIKRYDSGFINVGSPDAGCRPIPVGTNIESPELRAAHLMRIVAQMAEVLLIHCDQKRGVSNPGAPIPETWEEHTLR